MSSQLDRQKVITRALTYPYPRPSTTFQYPLHGAAPPASGTHVLVIGSNAAPSQLCRKFGDSPTPTILARRVQVHGLDVVYAARLSSYGSIPATITGCANVILQTHLLQLSDAQLARMHRTERGYAYCRFRPGFDVRITDENARDIVDDVYCYVAPPAKWGGLLCAVGDMNLVTGRSFVALSQTEMQIKLMQAAGETDGDVAQFVFRNVASEERRNIISRRFETFHHIHNCWLVVEQL